MDLFRSAQNPWGQEVLVGISWDVMWAVLILAAIFVVAHLVWMRVRGTARGESSTDTDVAGDAIAVIPQRIARHSVSARAFHWLMSVAMFALLITAFFPVLGIRFPWVTIHWVAGVALALVVAYHIVHATVWQDFWSMWVSPGELKRGVAELKHGLGVSSGPGPRTAKYPLDHQLYHHVTALVAGAAIVTGLLMMAHIDTPLWTQNPYLLSDSVWGLVYVVHGLSGVGLIGLVIGHVYFAVRPEKRWMTWSMIRGWIDREAYLAHHDPARWPVGGGGPDLSAVSGEQGGAPLEGAPSAPREGR